MALKLSDDEIWKWYEIIEAQKKSTLSIIKFCANYELDYKKFTNMKYRIVYTSYVRPDEYALSTRLAREFINGSMNLTDFCRINKINRSLICEAQTHIHYLDALERLKLERGEVQPMKFVQINKSISEPNHQAPSSEPEVIEPKNDIEIAITKGVRVIISAQIAVPKIIRIIELLKDL